jgi:hypothetical protein
MASPPSQPRSAEPRSPLTFFVLAAVLFAPFPVLAAVVPVSGLPKNAPVTDFVAAFVPATAALILVYRADGAGGVRRLLRRAVDHRTIRNKLWYLPVVLLPVVTLGATYGLMIATGWRFQHQPALSATTMLLFVPVYVRPGPHPDRPRVRRRPRVPRALDLVVRQHRRQRVRDGSRPAIQAEREAGTRAHGRSGGRQQSGGHRAVVDERVAPLVEPDQLGQQLAADPVGVAGDRLDRQPERRPHRGGPAGTGIQDG